MPTMNYVLYNSGLEMGTEYLTKEVAYFLGNIYSSGEFAMAGSNRFWVAPTRYNYGYATDVEIAEHFDLVKQLASGMGAKTLTSDNIKATFPECKKFRLPGFGTFFKSTNLMDLNASIPALEMALSESPWDVKRAFMVGVFDGRGSIDINKTNHNIRYIVLDCPTEEIGSFLYDLFESNGFSCNYNTSRDRKEGGEPRKSQLRIKDSEAFMARIGLISPKRFTIIRDAYQHTHSYVQTQENFDVLPGLKSVITR